MPIEAFGLGNEWEVTLRNFEIFETFEISEMLSNASLIQGLIALRGLKTTLRLILYKA